MPTALSSSTSPADGVSWNGWGPVVSRVPALSATRLPAGAELSIRIGRTVAVPEAIATGDTNRLRIAPCTTTTQPFASWPLATTLEQAIATKPRRPAGQQHPQRPCHAVRVLVHRDARRSGAHQHGGDPRGLRRQRQPGAPHKRGGQVRYAFRDAVPVGQLNATLRLNGTGWDALRAVLGVQWHHGCGRQAEGPTRGPLCVHGL